MNNELKNKINNNNLFGDDLKFYKSVGGAAAASQAPPTSSDSGNPGNNLGKKKNFKNNLHKASLINGLGKALTPVAKDAFSWIEKNIIDEPCLGNITEKITSPDLDNGGSSPAPDAPGGTPPPGAPPLPEGATPLPEGATSPPAPPGAEGELPIKKEAKYAVSNFVNYKGLFNWSWNGPGKVGLRDKNDSLLKRTGQRAKGQGFAFLKMIFCLAKLMLSPLYLFYFFYKYFAVFLKALNLFNFFKAVAQIILIVIGIITIPAAGTGFNLIQYAREMPFDDYDENGKLISTKETRTPLLSMLLYYAGMVLPLHFFNKKAGYNYGNGGLTAVGLVIIFVSGVTIIYGGFIMGLILVVFIKYLYQVIVGLKASATEVKSSGK